jgi:hypothetical protein
MGRTSCATRRRGEDGGHEAGGGWRRGQRETGGVGRRRAIEGREEGREGRGRGEQGARCRGEVGISGAEDVAGWEWRQNRAPHTGVDVYTIFLIVVEIYAP